MSDNKELCTAMNATELILNGLNAGMAGRIAEQWEAKCGEVAALRGSTDSVQSAEAAIERQKAGNFDPDKLAADLVRAGECEFAEPQSSADSVEKVSLSEPTAEWIISHALWRMYEHGTKNNRVSAQCEVQFVTNLINGVGNRTQPQTAPTREALESCKGEQLKFEEWAVAEKYDMHEHPLHYLFMDDKTNAARQGWKAALRYATTAIAGTQSQADSSPQSAPTREEIAAIDLIAWLEADGMLSEHAKRLAPRFLSKFNVTRKSRSQADSSPQTAPTEAFDFSASALAAERICDCMDNNLTKWDAVGEDVPTGAVELYETAKKLRDLLAPHKKETPVQCQAGIEQRHLAQLLTILSVMKSAHSKEPDRLMSIWSRDIEAVEAAVAALTRPLRPDEPAISSHQLGQGE